MKATKSTHIMHKKNHTHTLCRHKSANSKTHTHKRFNAQNWTQKVKQNTQRQQTDTQKGTNTTCRHKSANSKTHTYTKDTHTKWNTWTQTKDLTHKHNKWHNRHEDNTETQNCNHTQNALHWTWTLMHTKWNTLCATFASFGHKHRHTTRTVGDKSTHIHKYKHTTVLN